MTVSPPFAFLFTCWPLFLPEIRTSMAASRNLLALKDPVCHSDPKRKKGSLEPFINLDLPLLESQLGHMSDVSRHRNG